jgi:hypothetical protein
VGGEFNGAWGLFGCCWEKDLGIWNLATDTHRLTQTFALRGPQGKDSHRWRKEKQKLINFLMLSQVLRIVFPR